MRDLDENHLFIKSSAFPPQYQSVQQWLHYEVDQWNKKYTYVDETAKVDD